MHNMGKRPLCHMQTVTVQMSVHIHAVWSGHSLLVDIYYIINWVCKQAMKALISLHICAGWSEPALSAYCIRAFMQTSYNVWCLSSKDPDQLVHLCSLISAFTGYSLARQGSEVLQTDSKLIRLHSCVGWPESLHRVLKSDNYIPLWFNCKLFFLFSLSHEA